MRRLSTEAILGNCTEKELENDVQLKRLSKLVNGTKMIFVFILSKDWSLDNMNNIADRLRDIGHEVVIIPHSENDIKSFIADVAGRAGEKKIMICYNVSNFGVMWNIFYNLNGIYSNPDDAEELKFAVYNTRDAVRQAKRIDYGKVGGDAPLFSIVIPARGNAECLRYCIQTLMEQTCQEFEVIVSDNSNDGDTGVFDLVEELRWEKIIYVRPDRSLNLADSFEFAHQYTRGEYLLSLGADDGLLFHGIKTLKKLVEQSGYALDALVFDYVFYGWENALVSKFKNYIKIPKSIVKEKTMRKVKTVDTRELMLDYAGMNISFYKLPNGYMYSIISRRVFNELKNKLGRLFPAFFSHDTYTGCNICSFLNEVHSIDFPISIAGTSAPSIGLNASSGSDTAKVQHFCANDMAKLLFEERLSDINEIAPKETCRFLGDDTVNVDNILMSIERKLLPKEWIDKINWKRYFEMCLSHVYVDDSAEYFSAKLEDVREKVELRGDPEIIGWFYGEYYNNKSFKGSPVPSNAPFTNGLLPNGALYLNGADFDIHTVYDAAVLFEKLANFKTGLTYPPADW